MIKLNRIIKGFSKKILKEFDSQLNYKYDMKNLIAYSVKDKRDENQDYYIADKKNGIFIVADGLGGYRHTGSASCSAIASLTLHFELKDLLNDLQYDLLGEDIIVERIKSNIQYINQLFYYSSSKISKIRNCGTTLDAVLIYDNVAYIAHVGDGSISVIDKKEKYIDKITNEHVFLPEKYFDFSEIEKNVIKLHSGLINYVGQQENIQIDTYKIELDENKLIVMLTDGFHTITSPEILDILINKNINNFKEDMLTAARHPKLLLAGYDLLQEKNMTYDIKNKTTDNKTLILIGG